VSADRTRVRSAARPVDQVVAVGHCRVGSLGLDQAGTDCPRMEGLDTSVCVDRQGMETDRDPLDWSGAHQVHRWSEVRPHYSAVR